MKVQATNAQRMGLVITSNFVEAEDISDALRAYDVRDIVHRSTAADAFDLMSSDRPAPVIAVLSVRDFDDRVAELARWLQSAGSPQILINGDEKNAQAHSAVFLQRPFTDADLHRSLSDIIQPT